MNTDEAIQSVNETDSSVDVTSSESCAVQFHQSQVSTDSHPRAQQMWGESVQF